MTEIPAAGSTYVVDELMAGAFEPPSFVSPQECVRLQADRMRALLSEIERVRTYDQYVEHKKQLDSLPGIEAADVSLFLFMYFLRRRKLAKRYRRSSGWCLNADAHSGSQVPSRSADD